MSELYKKMYIALLDGAENALEYIDHEMLLPEQFDRSHAQKVFSLLQDALQKAEDLYVEAEED